MRYLIIFPILLIVGFIPSFIAFKRDHYSKIAILILNILFGATIIGWVILIIWAISEDNRIAPVGREVDLDAIPKKVCTECNSLIDADCTSCPKCGAKFCEEPIAESMLIKERKTWKCTKCGKINYIDSITCKECGNYK